MKKILTVFLVLTMLVGVFTIAPISVGATTQTEVWDGTVADSFAGGDGSSNSPYQISNGKELAYLAAQVNNGTTDFKGKYFILTNDIVLNEGNAADWATTAPVNNFTPIGAWNNISNVETDYAFGGHFNGNNKTISGLYINTSHDGDVALFGRIQGGTTIENLALVNSYVEATESGCAGALVGQTNRADAGNINITNVYVEATVKGNGNEVGGIIGNLSNTNDTFTHGKVTISKATFVGSVSGLNYAGGMIGNIRNVVIEVSDCLVYADVTATGGKYASGIVSRANNTLDKLGEAYKQVVINCVVAGKTVTGTGSDHRAFISSAKNTNAAVAKHSYNAIADLAHARNSDTVDEAPCADTRLAELYGKYEGETTVVWTNLTNWTRPQYDIARPAGIAENFEIIPITNYTITWKNADGTVLATETYETGETPEYKGETPTKAEDENYIYNFNGWTPEIKDVTEDATYEATYYTTRKNADD